MKNHVLRAAKINLDYAKKLLADLPDERMCEQPAPGMNHGAWVIGHLTYVADSMIGVFDQKPAMSHEWKELFNLASKPSAERTKYPSKQALVEAYEKAYARLTAAVEAASDEMLDREFPNPKLRSTLPTVGVAMAHILCSHHGMHLGQMSAWRRVLGLPPA
jgi:uncharacterized damage-inducible protein DinB